MDSRQSAPIIAHCGSVSSATNLPLELLHRIFYYSLPPYLERRPSRACSPLSLCQVSSTWREAARSVRDLWERLLLRQDSSQSSYKNRRKFIEASDLWFDRRGNHKISLQFDFDFGDWNGNPFSNIPALQGVVFPIAANVRDFALEVNSETQLDEWSTGWSTSMDALESFSLSITEGTSGPQYSTFPNLTKASNLRIASLSIIGDTLRHPEHVPLPWFQITHLALPHQTPFEGWHRLIRQLPNLEKGYVGFELIGDELNDDLIFDETFLSNLQPISLPALHTLIVGFHGDESPSSIFSGLTCPKLHTLSIISEDLEAGFPVTNQPLDFYIASIPTLQSLRLTRQKIAASDVLNILRAASGLRDLVLDCTGNHDPLLMAMEIKQPGPSVSTSHRTLDHLSLNILPHLETFTLYVLYPSDGAFGIHLVDIPTFHAAPFASAIISRWAQEGGPFASAHLYVGRFLIDIGMQVESLVRKQKKLGLDLTIEVLDLNNRLRGGEVARTRSNTWADWRLESGLISM